MRRNNPHRRLHDQLLLGITAQPLFSVLGVILLMLSLLGMTFPGGAQVLPPPPPAADSHQLSSGVQMFVKGFRFEGNTIFSSNELAAVVKPFVGKQLGTEELEQARRTVTLHYVERGFVNSGAVIPDQAPEDGVILIRIVEGRLTRVEIQSNRWLRDATIRRKLSRWVGSPLNLRQLQEGLQLLRQDPNVRQVNAELEPGIIPGESVLDLRVTDQHPFRVGVQVDNQRPSSVGSEQIWALASDLNLTGRSDPLELRYGVATRSADGMDFSGLDNLEGSYAVPFTVWDTTLGFHGSRLNSSLVEEPFTILDITSLTTSYGVQLRQPLYRTATEEWAVGLAFDRRENNTELLGQPFNLSPGAVDGNIRVSVLRFSQDWMRRGSTRVLAFRSTFNMGLDVFDSTDNRMEGDPDGRFFSWTGQGQYVQRLFQTQNEFLFRLTGQWSPTRLLALEQLSVGGYSTVRGYPENQLVRDRGIVSSAEFRIPVVYNRAGAGIVHLAPFFDFGAGWNEVTSPGPSTLFSVGSGLILNPNKHISAQLYWGYRLRHVQVSDDAGAQGLGLSFRVNIQAF